MTLRTHACGLKVQPANKMRFHGVESVEFQPVVPPSRHARRITNSSRPLRTYSLALVDSQDGNRF